jgi:hypothetical protein
MRCGPRAIGAVPLSIGECRPEAILCKIDRDGSSIRGGGLLWVGVHFSIQAEAARVAAQFRR